MPFRNCVLGSLVVALASACGGGGTGDAPAGAPLKVGVLVDLSGPTRIFGEGTLAGARMAAEEFNAAQGASGARIELVVEDDHGSPETARAGAQKLLGAGVSVIVGSTSSASTLAAAPEAQAAKVPIVTPTATAPEVTQIGDQVFRVCFLDSFQGEVMANFAHSSLGARRAAVLVQRDTPYSRGLAQYFKGEFVKQGGENVGEETYAAGDTEFGAQLRAIKAANPDVIFVPGYYNEAGLIAKQARAAGITVPLLGGDGWDAPQIWEIGGDAIDGSFISSHFSPEAPTPEIEKFVAAYQAGHAGRAPDAFAALGYDALNVLAHAFERAKSTAPGAMRSALTRTTSFPGVTGEITLNRERNALKDAVVVELRDGKSIYRATMSALLM